MSVHDTDKYDEVCRILDFNEGEPIFILRPTDKLIVPVLARYHNMARNIEDPELMPNQEWFDSLDDHIEAIRRWQNHNPDKVGIPD
jgi:hypothetical protein